MLTKSDLASISEIVNAIVDPLHQEMSAMKAEISGLRIDVNAMKSEMSSIRSDMDAMKAEVSDFGIEIIAVRTGLNVLKTEMITLKEDVNRLKDNVTESFESIRYELKDEIRYQNMKTRAQLSKQFMDMIEVSNREQISLIGEMVETIFHSSDQLYVTKDDYEKISRRVTHIEKTLQA